MSTRMVRSLLRPWPVSVADDLDEYSLRACAVEFGVIDLLPGAEVKLALGHGDQHLVADQQVLQVRIAVGLPGAVMTVVGAKRRELFEPFLDVCNQPVFGIVDSDLLRDPPRRGQRYAVPRA